MKMFLMFFLAACSFGMPAWADEPVKPAQLEVYYGNQISGYSTLKLENSTLLYTDHNGRIPKQEIIDPSPEQWKKFRSDLDNLNVWSWQSQYNNPSMMDGTHWRFTAVYGDQSIISQGSNAYPLADGTPALAGAPGTKEHFARLLAALKDLTGKEIR